MVNKRPEPYKTSRSGSIGRIANFGTDLATRSRARRGRLKRATTLRFSARQLQHDPKFRRATNSPHRAGLAQTGNYFRRDRCSNFILPLWKSIHTNLPNSAPAFTALTQSPRDNQISHPKRAAPYKGRRPGCIVRIDKFDTDSATRSCPRQAPSPGIRMRRVASKPLLPCRQICQF